MKRISLGRLLAFAAAVVVTGNAAVADVFDYFDEAGQNFRSAGTRMVAWWKEAAPISNDTVVAEHAVGGECCEDGCGDGCTQTGCGDGCPAPLMTPNMIGAPMFPVPAFVTTGAGALLDFRQMTRVSDNNNARPQDRVAVMYNFVNDINVDVANGQFDHFHLYDLLVEKTFLDGQLSLSAILPAADANSHQINAAGTYAGEWELGDIAVGVKAMLASNDTTTVSVGVLAEIPTGNQLSNAGMGGIITADEWHFTPYLAAMFTPTDKLFVNFFASYRMPTGAEGTFVGGAFVSGVEFPDMLMLDLGVGYWLRKDAQGGVAWITELHYTGTTSPVGPAIIASSTYGEIHHLYLTSGVTANIGNRATFTVGASVPLRDPNAIPPVWRTDKWYNLALTAQVNIYFGQK